MDNIDKIFKDSKAVQRVKKLIHTRLGIHIKSGKELLLRQRLGKLIQHGDISDLNDLCDQIELIGNHDLLLKLATLISTNHTYFFREKTHFAFFKTNILPNLVPEYGKIRLWSAAASSGEEAYTLSMVMADAMGPEKFSNTIRILGTDISQRVLERAEAGIYQLDNLEKIPKNMRLSFTESQKPGFFKIKQKLRSNCLFRRLNLKTAKYPFKNRFHVIFCRNVFIYFDASTQESICNEFARVSMPDAYLFVSQTESLRNLNVPWEYVNPGIYRKITKN
ncbi:chemotaxis protein methyltransferase CheR [Candidatus Magnetomoraceae bacterium gMMP-1]